MSRFEHAAPDVVGNPPVPPPDGRGRRRRPGALLAAAGVLVVLALAGLLARSADGSDPGAAQSRPPAAVVSAARDLLASLVPGYTVTGEAEWVLTTRRRYEQVADYHGGDPDEQVYVVQVRGRFTCAACSRPYGAAAQTGSAVGTAFPVDGRGESSGRIGDPVELGRLATVHTFPVS